MSSTIQCPHTHPIIVPATEHLSQHQAQSDCGHGSPQLKRGYSLLRSFSLRSTISSTLHKSRDQHRLQLPQVSLSPYESENISRSTTSQSKFRSHSSESCSSDINSSSPIWKKWRVTSVSEHSNGGEDSLAGSHDDTMSSPIPQRGPKKKRSLFLPSITVSRLIAPFQISSSSSSLEQDSSCVLTTPPQSQSESVLQPHGFDTQRVTVIEDEDGFVGLVDGRVDRGKVETQNQLQTEAHTKTRSNSELGSGSQPTNHLELLPPLLPILPTTFPLGSLGPMLFTIDASEPPSSSSTSTPTPEPTPQSSSNSTRTSDLNLNLKPSISQKRRAMFTLGNESDLDSDSLGVSTFVSEAAVKAVSNSNAGSGSNPESIMLLPNNSARTTAGIQRPPFTRHERFVVETRDQSGINTPSSVTTSSPITGSATATTTSTADWKSTRRWTLSSALTDEGTSDEGLIKELERMREILQWEATDMDGPDTSLFPSPPPSPSPSSPHPSPSNSSPTWLTTQRALLTTRELILTERHYLSSLLMLLCPDSTLTSVPEMMISYVKELVSVSERLLKGMEGEPSVRGVAEVFVEVGGLGVGGQMNGDGDSDEIGGAESAFVGWCSVVGTWFQDDIVVSGDTHAMVGAKRKGKSDVGGGSREEHHLISGHEGSSSTSNLGVITSSSPSSTFSTTEHARTSPLMRTVSTWRRSMPSISGLGEGGVWRNRDKDEGDSYGHTDRMSPTSPTSGAIGTSASMTSTSNSKPVRKPTVRDLAILPTQRVMRYVLLYRDLLANTPPSSSSYPIVERAVEVACRIAEKCDRAQVNAAFIVDGSGRHSGGSSSSGSSNSMLNNVRRCSSKRTILPEFSSKLKAVGLSVHTTSSSPTNSTTNSPTRSCFFPSSSISTSPFQSPSKLRPTSLPPLSLPSSPSPSKSRSRSTPLPPPLSTSPIKNRGVTIPIPPPSSFPSKIPKSGGSFGPLSTYLAGSSSPTTITSSPSSSASPAFFSPMSASSS